MAFLLAACGGEGEGPFSSNAGSSEVWVPPTRAASPTPLPTQVVVIENALPPATQVSPPCTDNLTFQADLTIPDGTVVAPGEQLDKRWQVDNSGTCNWDETYSVRLTGGPAMGVPETQALYPARAGTEAVIRMIYTAPAEPGTYRSAWQAYDPEGTAFGDPFFIEIVVQE